jgi:hypothetical protein
MDAKTPVENGNGNKSNLEMYLFNKVGRNVFCPAAGQKNTTYPELLR